MSAITSTTSTSVSQQQQHPTAPAPAGTRIVLADRYKTKMCEKWAQLGKCSYERKCMFAHGDHELRTYEMNLLDGLTSEENLRQFRRLQRVEFQRFLARQERRQFELFHGQPATSSQQIQQYHDTNTASSMATTTPVCYSQTPLAGFVAAPSIAALTNYSTPAADPYVHCDRTSNNGSNSDFDGSHHNATAEFNSSGSDHSAMLGSTSPGPYPPALHVHPMVAAPAGTFVADQFRQSPSKAALPAVPSPTKYRNDPYSCGVIPEQYRCTQQYQKSF